YVGPARLTWLHGEPVAIGRRLVGQAWAVGFPGCRVALAGSRTAARVAAVSAAEPVTVISPGEERAALAGAPLAVLGLPPDLAAVLEGWGVRTLGELAALPRDGLAARLGPAGLRAPARDAQRPPGPGAGGAERAVAAARATPARSRCRARAPRGARRPRQCRLAAPRRLASPRRLHAARVLTA